MTQPSVLITGASGNMGSAIVKKMQSENYQVYATARNATGLEGAEVTAVDLTNETAVNDYITNIISKDTNLKTAILLVGGFATGDLKNTDGAALQKMYKLNFETAYFAVRALLHHFEANGGGHFLLVSARSALLAQEAQHAVAYSLSKSLVLYLAEIINAYGKSKGIRASVIIPGTIDTPQNRQAMPRADFSKWTSTEAIADAIYFLLTDAGEHLRETVLKMYNES
ncbi:MAG TPA: SDR family NAD(P)-dependent oxidoreductase [Saprospiraceae bacterium]|nr:SDR family NAD(P)-dependent oxidoreductase [Saprospiraceae bacterium]HMP14847.1 SDR family NAD(P)-dependent oxidoreductase [Saprospiraceae bacterium]